MYVSGNLVLLIYLTVFVIVTVEQVLIGVGVEIGYGSPRTLTDVSCKNCRGDLTELRPTLLAGVPIVWETIRKNILLKVQEQRPRRQKIFWGAVELKWWLMSCGLPTGILDSIVFKKVQQATGGRLRFALSGGAAIAQETHKFLSVALCPIMQGYGMTETCGVIAIQTPNLHALNSVGQLFPCLEMKLVTVAEIGYFADHDPPQGEIWVRGQNVMSGYYKLEEETKATLTADGWLKTGDIGQFAPDGTLSIIDRRKTCCAFSSCPCLVLTHPFF